MKFRRSTKSEKHDSAKPVHVSIPQKDAIAIEPPKKVIKALYDYTPNDQSDIYLSFSAGDFLHVVSREHDSDWYEACNPLKNERGLVPVKFFDDVGKTVRSSGDSSNQGTHDSGYAESSTTPPAQSMNASRMTNGSSVSGHRTSKSVARAAGGVYGIVSYDFNAERPDELDAKEGEAIIVIAQSNPEWFVAKPITRLGGPGLIPVSFIEIRDMTTGKAVEDPVAAVQKAGIPRVEEWKKMAAEYKNTSIPLGTVSSSQQIQGLQQDMARLSVGSQESGMPTQQQMQNLLSPTRASVPRYIYGDDKFHFIVECQMSNGQQWDLSRIYEDFYQLQIKLIDVFPEESGKTGKERILPYMPGPVQFVTDNISEGRRENLNTYLRDLLRLPEHITNHWLVKQFFAPRQGDYEVDSNASARYSQASQTSYQNGAYQQQRQPPGNIQQPYGQQPGANGYNHQRSQGSLASSQQDQRSHNRGPSGQPSQQSLQGAGGYAGAPPASETPVSGGPVKVKAWFDRDTCVVIRMPARGQFGFEQLHQKIVERRKLEYKGQDQSDSGDLDIEYRDEQDGDYYRLEGNEDLEIALERNEKLTLAVRAASS